MSPSAEPAVAPAPGTAAHRWTALAVVAALAAVGVAAFWFLSPAAILRVFSCDDSYYFAAIARELALHGVSSFDGRTPTNGYQPLWTWLQVPIFWCTDDPWAAVRLARSIEVLLVAVGCVAWLSVLWRVGVTPLVSLLLLPFFVRTHVLFVGMETATNVTTLGLAALALGALLQAKKEQQVARGVLLGAAMAACGLARLDNLAFGAAVGAWLTLRHRALGIDRRVLLAVALPPLCVFMVYGAANLVQFGTAVPVSGLVKQWWSSTVGEPGLARLGRRLFGLLAHRPALEGVLYGVVLVGLTRWRMRGLLPGAVGLLVLAIGKVGYYAATVEPWLADYGWYFASGTLTRQLAIVVLVHLVVAALLARWPRVRPLVLAVAGVVVVAQVGRQFSVYRGYVTRDETDWEMLSYEGVRWLADNVPHDARIGSFDAGVLGYFAPQKVTNLDGLVNSLSFLEARRAGEPLLDYLDRERIDFIVNVVADPFVDFPAKGMPLGPGTAFEVRHLGERTAWVDDARRRLAVLGRRAR